MWEHEHEADVHTASAIQKQKKIINIDFQFHFPLYSAQDPSAWDGTTHIQPESSLIHFTSLVTSHKGNPEMSLLDDSKFNQVENKL